jgi:biopolymer transport protein ExbD
MRVKVRKFGEMLEADMTPMIDMTFQLIAFFMVLVNFTQAEQDARVLLPTSVLAKPPDKQPEQPLTIQIAWIKELKDYRALVAGDEITIGPELDNVLSRERRVFGRMGKAAKEVIVIIRAHKSVDTGKVQEVIELAQKQQFEKFRLRVKEDPR